MAFSVKIKQESVDQFRGELAKAFSRVISSPQMLNEIGQTIVADVVDQTRNKEKSIPLESELRLLKDKWITRRTRLASVNNTGDGYQEGRSNLTFTGQLLDSFAHKILGPGKILMKFLGMHKGYTNLDGSKQPDISNADLAKYVADGGRPFVGVRPTIRRAINRIVKKFVKRSLVVSRLTKQ